MAKSGGMAKAKGKGGKGKPNQKKGVPHTKKYGTGGVGKSKERGGGAVPMR